MVGLAFGAMLSDPCIFDVRDWTAKDPGALVSGCLSVASVRGRVFKKVTRDVHATRTSKDPARLRRLCSRRVGATRQICGKDNAPMRHMVHVKKTARCMRDLCMARGTGWVSVLPSQQLYRVRRRRPQRRSVTRSTAPWAQCDVGPIWR